MKNKNIENKREESYESFCKSLPFLHNNNVVEDTVRKELQTMVRPSFLCYPSIFPMVNRFKWYEGVSVRVLIQMCITLVVVHGQVETLVGVVLETQMVHVWR
eukprot:GHVR01141104.1.p2 GENE.GHVR01141104.1~~GHVR01141104.1.p2  ORF type:complete len:102 (+),score=21.04 GHVR01141104.1:193-498(+)